MNVWKALALGASVGFVFALASGCPGPACSAANCAGCCDSTTHSCILFASQSSTKCGTLGNTCASCSGTQVCSTVGGGGSCTTGGGGDGGPGCSATNPCPNGCCNVALGLCLGATGQTHSNCGRVGTVCNACPNPGDVCTVDGSGNGTCGSGPPDGGPNGGVGNPCTSDQDCRSAGLANGTCVTAIPDGGLPYPNGYCTIVGCNPQSSTSCPGTSQCVPMGSFSAGGTPLSIYGEKRTLCLAACQSDYDCRAPDYACFAGNQINATNNGFTCAGGGCFGCFINPPARDGETGSACTTFQPCALPPTNGGCIPPTLADGGPTGWTGGYCTSNCIAALFSSSSDTYCGDGGVCLVDSPYVDGFGNPLSADCYEKCPSPNMAPGGCRAGYTCLALQMVDGGALSFGACQPACNAPGAGCTPGSLPDGGNPTCNTTTGLCQ